MSRNPMVEGFTGGSSGGSVGGTLAKTVGPDVDAIRQEKKRELDVDVDRLADLIDRREAEPPHFSNRRSDPDAPWRSEYDSDSRPLPEFILPGFGESYDDCGRPYLLSCENHGHVHETTRTPGRSTCPFCAPVWARNRAEKIVAKLEALRRNHFVQGNYDALYHHHMVISPDPSEGGFHVEADSRAEAYEKGVDMAQEILEELGSVVEFFAYHSHRGDHSDDDSLQDDRGAWKERLFSGREWEGDVHDELEHSPHFHAVAISEYMVGQSATKKLEEETGWIVERIANEETGKSIDDIQDLARVVTYMLSHTGLYQASDGSMRSATRWRGEGINDFSYDEIKPEIRRDATQAVREAAKETLGLPPKDNICHADIGADRDTSFIGEGTVPDPVVSGGSSGGSSGGTSDSSDDVDAYGLPQSGAWDTSSSGDTWSVPSTTSGRLEAMRKASPAELIAEYDDITEDNVWTVKNRLEEAEADEDVCGGVMRPAHVVIPKLDDPDWVDGAESVDELVEAVDDLLQEETIDAEAVQEDLDELRDRDVDDLDELASEVEDLLEDLPDHVVDEEFPDVRRYLEAVSSRLGSGRRDVDIARDEAIEKIGRVVDDVEAIPGYLKPVTNAIADLDEDWFAFDPGEG